MDKNTERSERGRKLLLKHYQRYPKLQTEDIFKYLFQSVFGCEHMVANEDAVLEYIKREYAQSDKTAEPFVERLGGAYSRVHLSWIDYGLAPETLSKLFFFSSRKEENGADALEEKLRAARELVAERKLPLDREEFDKKLGEWRAMGYPALHHSEVFRTEYRPAYRVIANEYADFLPVFSKIDKLLSGGSATIALEGGSASGKTTLAGILERVYDCNVFHMDDFFLRPEQRTPSRFAEVGGNVDRERFLEEVLAPNAEKREVYYRRFDCATQKLEPAVRITPKKLTIVEGAYSMHPDLEKYYDCSVYLDIDPEYQRERILKRNPPQLAKRFFDEWIPLENIYFSKMDIKERCELILPIRIYD